jgi:hypothetical protein
MFGDLNFEAALGDLALKRKARTRQFGFHFHAVQITMMTASGKICTARRSGRRRYGIPP